MELSREVGRLADTRRATLLAWTRIDTRRNWCDPDRRRELLRARRDYQDATIALVEALRSESKRHDADD